MALGMFKVSGYQSRVSSFFSRKSLSEIERLEVGFKKAVKRYRRAAKLSNCEGPFLIADQVSACTYEEWILKIESAWRIGYVPICSNKGIVILYGDPSKVHEGSVAWFNYWVARQVDDALRGHGIFFSDVVYMLGAADHKLPGGIIKRPDAAYASCSVKPPRKPRVTLEVAYKNESLEKLVDEVQLWHSWGVVFSLGVKIDVKISGQRGEKKVNTRMFWVQQCKDQREPSILEFGPDVCTAPNQPEFVFACPITYFSDDISLDGSITFDLFTVQREIWRLILDEAEDNQCIISLENGVYRYSPDAICQECFTGFNDKTMIQCDSAGCNRWYHLECFGLSEDVGKDACWLCPSCSSKDVESALGYLSNITPCML